MDNTVPKNAVERNEVVVELCGKSYTFREPCKLKAQTLYGKAILLAADFALDKTEVSELVETGRALMAAPAMLDWCVDALDLQAAERKRAEDAFEPPGADVVVAWTAIFKVLKAPFVGGTPATVPAPPAQATPSTNGETETVSCSGGESPGSTLSGSGP